MFFGSTSLPQTSAQRIGKSYFRERRDSNPGLLGEWLECYLRIMHLTMIQKLGLTEKNQLTYRGAGTHCRIM